MKLVSSGANWFPAPTPTQVKGQCGDATADQANGPRPRWRGGGGPTRSPPRLDGTCQARRDGLRS